MCSLEQAAAGAPFVYLKGMANNTKRTTTKTATKAPRGYKANPIAAPVVIAPETNEADYTPAQRAAAHFQTIPTDVLTAFVRGDVNALATVLDELASRGRNPLTGEWIGFEGGRAEAAKLKDVLDARELPKIRISRDGRREYLTNDPTGARLVYVTIPE